MKQVIQIEIERPSIAPTCFRQEPAEIPDGLPVEVSVIDDSSLWGTAVWRGRVVVIQDKDIPTCERA